MVIDDKEPHQPAKARIVLTATLHLTGRSYTAAIRVNPCRKGRPIKLANQFPDRLSRMIFFHQPVNIQHLPTKLPTIGLSKISGSSSYRIMIAYLVQSRIMYHSTLASPKCVAILGHSPGRYAPPAKGNSPLQNPPRTIPPSPCDLTHAKLVYEIEFAPLRHLRVGPGRGRPPNSDHGKLKLADQTGQRVQDVEDGICDDQVLRSHAGVAQGPGCYFQPDTRHPWGSAYRWTRFWYRPSTLTGAVELLAQNLQDQTA
ncbi:transposase domain protein [Ochrobactrum quorumnocens]|uniref:Transposase domain protein n=1 Tax=Ochrobactrum quorumnocens TaxID=271865 RepID=A0A248UCI4_9HYPH|nr:transposase domain protein [[Ochrobactrum] quorumnocens]